MKTNRHILDLKKVIVSSFREYYNLETKFSFSATKFNPRWNLKNLSRGLNPPKSAKTRFKFSAGLNLETFNTILSGTNNI